MKIPKVVWAIIAAIVLAIVQRQTKNNVSITSAESSTSVAENVTIQFTSEPTTSVIYINGAKKGQTPISVNVPINVSFSYLVEPPTLNYLNDSYSGNFIPTKDDAISVSLPVVDEAKKVQKIEEILRDQDMSIYIDCQGIVEERLKSPSSAEFGFPEFTYNVSERKLIVVSQVAAQNSFGAMLRNKFLCTYTLDNNTVTLEYLGE